MVKNLDFVVILQDSSFFLPKAEKINNFNKQIESMFAKIQTNQTQIQTLENSATACSLNSLAVR